MLIVCLQETLPEEAAGHNPLLPAAPQQDETSPTSKVIFIPSFSSSSSSSSSTTTTRDVSQRSNLMRGRKSNCCQPLHSSALMIAPPSFMRRVNPCGNSYHQRRYNQLLSFLWEFLFLFFFVGIPFCGNSLFFVGIPITNFNFSLFSAGREVEHDRLREDAAFH